ncbi:MAG TPA: DUF362 domain-containing protein [Candidatus Saccharimonadales bacterium]|nr:DUF362 domain-containing protein [Candidatus Saccharimonadales bacterium]
MKNGIFYCLCWIGAVSGAISAEPPPSVGGPPERARVVMVEDSNATVAFEPRPAVVLDMVNRGIEKLTGKGDVKSAWQTFVAPKDVIGLKVYSGPGANSGTRPAVVEAVVQGLLEAGIPATHIIVWDRRLVDLRLAGFSYLAGRYNIGLAGSADAGYDEKVFYDNELPGTLIAGDLDFDRTGATSGRKSYVSKLLTGSITKIINIAPLLNHNLAGVCGNLYSLAMGSVDNTDRFLPNGERLARAVPEIYALTNLSDHVVLSITDALIGQYQGEEMSLLHYSTELNQIWLSQDPVALDVLAVQELDRERQMAKMPSTFENPELFQNAAALELGVPDPSKIHLDVLH